jgi:hypothetical protein
VLLGHAAVRIVYIASRNLVAHLKVHVHEAGVRQFIQEICRDELSAAPFHDIEFACI